MKINEKEPNIYDAMICVMKEVKNIEKSMTIGTGNNSYKGISDKDVKQKIGESMAKNNLVCFPIKIEPKTNIERWEEMDNYSKTMKTKQSIFTEVLVTYRIVYSLTGESIEIQGFGYGADTQDKGAGKATTYALKNALLYTFLVPTGTIEDTDKTHSDNIAVPQNKPTNLSSVITALTFKAKGDKGDWFDVKLENGLIGIVLDKNKTLKVGSTIVYTTESKKDKEGVEYTKINLLNE